MPVKLVKLAFVQGKTGFDIQGLQKSAIFDGYSIEDIGIHSIKPNDERGSHYHIQKIEWLLPLSGSASFFWSDEQNPINVSKLQLRANWHEPYIVEISPMTSHIVRNTTKEEFIMASFSTRDFDSLHSDNFKVVFQLKDRSK